MMWRTGLLVMVFFVYGIAGAEENAMELPINWGPLPPPYHTPSATNPPKIIPRPDGATLDVPPGFVVEEYLSGFNLPRFMLAGPHGEIFLSDMGSGVIYVNRKRKAFPLILSLDTPYGLVMNKDWLYVAEPGSVKRYRYDADAMRVKTPGEEVVPLQKFDSGHWTRSLLFNREGTKVDRKSVV